MSADNPSPEELKLLATLVRVCGQFMPGSLTSLDHEFLSAGELAVHVLADFGLLIPDGRGGAWTARAAFLDQIDVYDGDLEAIKLRYLAISSGELFAPPGRYRSRQPDVQLDHLRLWFPSRAISKYSSRPNLGSGPGSNRLDVEVRLEPVGAVSTIAGELLTVPEVRDFRDQLQAVHEGSVRKAKLVGYKNTLVVYLKAARSGDLQGEINVHNPLYNNTLKSDIKFLTVDHLPNIIEALDNVIAKFPLIEQAR